MANTHNTQVSAANNKKFFGMVMDSVEFVYSRNKLETTPFTCGEVTKFISLPENEKRYQACVADKAGFHKLARDLGWEFYRSNKALMKEWDHSKDTKIDWEYVKGLKDADVIKAYKAQVAANSKVKMEKINAKKAEQAIEERTTTVLAALKANGKEVRFDLGTGKVL